MTKQFLNFPFEVKAADVVNENGAEFGYFEGYASTFGNLDSYDDIVMKGAFVNSLKKRKVKMCWQHNFDQVIGSFPEIREDDAGLYVKGRINFGVAKGREAYALLKAGDLDSMSIGYSTVISEYNNETGVRLLKELELYEISIVTEPANALATVTGVKSLEELDSLKDIEAVLRNQGFSKEASKLLVSRVKALSAKQREVEEAEQNQQREADEIARLIASTQSTLTVLKVKNGKEPT